MTKSELLDLNRLVEIADQKKRTTDATLKQLKEQLTRQQTEADAALEAQKIIQELAQTIQQTVQKKVARIVSKCLTAVFDRPYDLRIEFERKRGKTEAQFRFMRDGRKINPFVCSGGVWHIAALALRVAAIALKVPKQRQMLVLDEPFQGLSQSNLSKMGRLIHTLQKELGIQFLIVTHNQALEIGKVVHLDCRSQ